ncbi:MAG: endolytic transglycosylase MltG [Acidimicrobiia bacterium]|nr:endolytic transglycosylase MltG [Acidimicrobiia bacterium]
MTLRAAIRWGLATGVLAIAGLAAVAAVVWNRVQEPFKGYTAAERFVEIAPQTSVPGITRQLVEAGVVRDAFTFRLALRQSGAAERLQAGEYRFDRPLSAPEVVDLLVRGAVYTRPITFPEGLTVAEMAALFEAAGFGTAEAFVEAAADPAAIADLDPDATTLEGYLFPDTYRLARRDPVGLLVQQMVARFRRVFGEDLRERAAAAGLSVRETVSLAALIEKETGAEHERPLVAAVYRNRLDRGMPMQADPTVIYALQLAGRYDGNIRRDDLQFDSPYNTYRYPGLPPGPIASPGEASLRAALDPAEVPYLYFVSRNDGTHAFAETLAAHNRNVQEFQIRYFRERRRRAAEVAAAEPAP